jgi:lipid-A-disaccharide synthase
MEDNKNVEPPKAPSSLREAGGISLLLSAGEASGDAVAGALLDELKRLGFEGKAFAIGGPCLRKAGAVLIADSRRWGAIGVARSLLVTPRVLAGYFRVKRWLKRTKPSVVVGVDFGFFNVRLLRYAKALGLKTLYFMPPGSWRREYQGKDLARVADIIATPFSWSAELLRASGAHAYWVGHPAVQMVGEIGERDRDAVTVLPGSRWHEVTHNLPVIVRALDLLQETKTMRILVVVAPSIDPEALRRLWMQAQSRLTPFGKKKVPCFVPSPPYDALKESRCAIVCSGTATLESALCECPLVVLYRGDWLMKLEYFLRRPRLEYIALPNIILGRGVVPELIQDEATPEALAEHLRPLLSATDARAEQLSAFRELREVLGPADALTRCAQLVKELCQQGFPE